MQAWLWILVVAVILLVAAGVVAFLLTQRRRTGLLRRIFASEYDRVVASANSRRTGERILQQRLRRRSEYELRALDGGLRERYLQLWRSADTLFLDSPSGAVGQALGLLTDLMRQRGYPEEAPERRADDLSVDHPVAAQSYRDAYAVAQANERGDSTTDDLRRAMVDLKIVFEALIGVTEAPGSVDQPRREAE
jgi:hypothetical protein